MQFRAYHGEAPRTKRPACASRGSLLLTAPARLPGAPGAAGARSSAHEDFSSQSGDGALRRQAEAGERSGKARNRRALAQASQRRKGPRSRLEQEAAPSSRHSRAREEGVRKPREAHRLDPRSDEAPKGRESP